MDKELFSFSHGERKEGKESRSRAVGTTEPLAASHLEQGMRLKSRALLMLLGICWIKPRSCLGHPRPCAQGYDHCLELCEHCALTAL